MSNALFASVALGVTLMIATGCDDGTAPAGGAGGAGSTLHGSTGATMSSTTMSTASTGTTGSTTSTGSAMPPKSPWVSGYYVGWEQDTMAIDTVDASAMTHLIAFSLAPLAGGQIDDPYALDHTAIVARAHGAGRKAVVSIGVDFSGIGVADLDVLAQGLAKFAADYDYDGVDVDWEPIDDTFVAFIPKLRAALAPGKSILVPVGVLNDTTQFTRLAQVIDALDQVNLETYDMSGPYPGWVSWHSSPLFDGGHTFPSTGGPLPSVDGSVEAALAAGLPKEKLGIGIGFVGERWHDTTAALEPADGVLVDFDVYYRDIVDAGIGMGTPGFDEEAKVPFLSDATTQTWLTYESEQSIHAKADYVALQGLGGAILWQIAAGRLTNGGDPLLAAVKDSFQL